MRKQKRNQTFDDICGFVVTGALNDTKKIRKAGGKIFANVRPAKQDKPKTKQEKIGQMLVTRALNNTEKIPKAGGICSPIFGPDILNNQRKI